MTGRYADIGVEDDMVWQSYMLPAADGTLEVQAHCMRHYARQSQADLKAGRVAICRVCPV